MKRKNLVFLAVFTTAIVALTACGGGGGFNAKEVKLATEIDSINYTLGLSNGAQIKQMYLANDSNKNAVVDFIKGMDKEYANGKGKSEVYMQGFGLGQWLKDQQEKGLFENPKYKLNIDVMKQGFINAFLKYQDKEGMTAGMAQGYVQQVFRKIQMEKYQEQMKQQQQMQQQLQSADSIKKADSAKIAGSKK